jgi:hypothetical protein
MFHTMKGISQEELCSMEEVSDYCGKPIYWTGVKERELKSSALGRAYTHRHNQCPCWCRCCCHQYNPGLVYTHTDKITVGTCKAVNFVRDAELSTWLLCGMGGFTCSVCFISGEDNVYSREKENFGSVL